MTLGWLSRPFSQVRVCCVPASYLTLIREVVRSCIHPFVFYLPWNSIKQPARVDFAQFAVDTWGCRVAVETFGLLYSWTGNGNEIHRSMDGSYLSIYLIHEHISGLGAASYPNPVELDITMTTSCTEGLPFYFCDLFCSCMIPIQPR